MPWTKVMHSVVHIFCVHTFQARFRLSRCVYVVLPSVGAFFSSLSLPHKVPESRGFLLPYDGWWAHDEGPQTPCLDLARPSLKREHLIGGPKKTFCKQKFFDSHLAGCFFVSLELVLLRKTVTLRIRQYRLCLTAQNELQLHRCLLLHQVVHPCPIHSVHVTAKCLRECVR